MRASDFQEQGTIPSTTAPTSATANITGNVAQLQTPGMAAATLAQQQQQKTQAKNQILKQIQSLQQQITALRSQQASIK